MPVDTPMSAFPGSASQCKLPGFGLGVSIMHVNSCVIPTTDTWLSPTCQRISGMWHGGRRWNLFGEQSSLNFLYMYFCTSLTFSHFISHLILLTCTVWVISKSTTYGVHLIPQSNVISNCKHMQSTSAVKRCIVLQLYYTCDNHKYL